MYGTSNQDSDFDLYVILAEKMLKEFFASTEKEIPKTHDLMRLCRLCMETDDTFDDLFNSCSRLMPYGVQVRYSNHTELYEEDMRMSLKDSEKIMDMLYIRGTVKVFL